MKNANEGLSLIEVLISFSILLIVLLGSFVALGYYSLTVSENLARDEAVRILVECVEDLRIGVSCPESVERDIGAGSLSFNVTAPDPNSLRDHDFNSVTVIVSWVWKGRLRSLNATTTIYAY